MKNAASTLVPTKRVSIKAESSVPIVSVGNINNASFVTYIRRILRLYGTVLLLLVGAEVGVSSILYNLRVSVVIPRAILLTLCILLFASASARMGAALRTVYTITGGVLHAKSFDIDLYKVERVEYGFDVVYVDGKVCRHIRNPKQFAGVIRQHISNIGERSVNNVKC